MTLIDHRTALIIVDVQNDFLPGGALGVPGGFEIIPFINQAIPKFDHVVATFDWHPRNHCSFVTQYPGKNIGDEITLFNPTRKQHCWPEHCVVNTEGAKLSSELIFPCRPYKDILKGTLPDRNAYSGFYDDCGSPSELAAYLRKRDIIDVYIVGLATDFCVKETAIDAVKDNFVTYVLLDGCRAVNLNPRDEINAIVDMTNAGVKVVRGLPIERDI